MGQRIFHPGNGYVVFLHGLQQGGLGAWAGPVDFIRHQQLGEHGAVHKAEAAVPVGILVQNLAASNVGGHQVGGELNAPCVQPQYGAKGVDQQCFAQTRSPDKQGMATSQNGGQGLADNLLLPENEG